MHNFSPSEIAAFILSQRLKMCQLVLFYYPASAFGETLHANCGSLFSQHKLQPFKHLDHLDIVLENRRGLALRLLWPLFYMEAYPTVPLQIKGAAFTQQLKQEQGKGNQQRL